MVVVNILFSIILLELIWVQALPEEAYQQYPLPVEDDDLYLYMDQRSETDPKMSAARRRSTLDRNFARFGRGDLPPIPGYDYIASLQPATFNRPTRSGDKNDHFIRFGRDYDRQRYTRNVGRAKRDTSSSAVEVKRGGNNFVRFGRANDNFMRFGREPEFVNKEATTLRRPSNASKNEHLLELLIELLNKEHVRLD